LSAPWRSLRDLLANPAASALPPVVVSRLAWAGRTTLLAAREKDGKSTLTAAAAAAVTTGGLFLGEPTTRGSVLWVGVEEHPDDIARRAMALGTDPDRLFVLGPNENPMGTLKTAVTAVQPVYVVIDTLMTWAVEYVDDPYSAASWAPVMSALTALAHESGAAFTLNHHARKSDGKYRDSTAIGAGVDVILEMGSLADDRAVRVVTARGRWAMKGFSVRYRGDGFDLTAGELTVDARVLLVIEQHPGMSKRRVREQVGGRAQVVDASLETLEARGAIERREDGYYPVSQPEQPDTVRDTGGVPTQVVAGQSRDTLGDTGGVPLTDSKGENGTPPPVDGLQRAGRDQRSRWAAPRAHGDPRPRTAAGATAVTLADVLGQFERRAADAEREGATAPIANIYRVVLEELRSLPVTEGAAPPPVVPDRLMNVTDAAKRMGVTPQWLYRHATQLPFTRRLSAKVLRFSEAGLARYLERLR
jgi:hypothetical protein